MRAWVLLYDDVITLHETREGAFRTIRANHEELAGLTDAEIEARIGTYTDFVLEEQDVLS